MSLYVYRAVLLDVTDGDTVKLDVDCGFGIHRTDHFRLAGIDAPERGTVEGAAATGAVTAWFGAVPAPVCVQTLKDRREKWGRYLAWIYSGARPPIWPAPTGRMQAEAVAEVAGGDCLNVALVLGGHASWYWGGARAAE